MKDANLFELLAKYHIEHNLRQGLENEVIRNGVMYSTRRNGEQVAVEVGKENKMDWYRGIVLFSNGADIVEYLRDAGVVPSSEPLTFVDIKDETDFIRFLDAAGEYDGAALYSAATGKGTRLLLNNSTPNLEDVAIEGLLPAEYMSEDGSVPFFDGHGWKTIGTRTHLAIKITQKLRDRNGDNYPIDACLVKHTVYNPLGFGPVVHFSRDAMEMFFFRYAPDARDPFIDEEHRIAGVYRKYEFDGNRFNRVMESAVQLERDKDSSHYRLAFPRQ